jgi:hypothetical protein
MQANSFVKRDFGLVLARLISAYRKAPRPTNRRSLQAFLEKNKNIGIPNVHWKLFLKAHEFSFGANE